MDKSFYIRLYALIPDFSCPKPGCAECCQAIPCHPWEERRIKRYLRKRHVQLEPGPTTSCPLLGAKGCLIYPVRPMVCRLYGQTSPAVLCPYRDTKKPLQMSKRLWDMLVQYAMYSKDHAVLLTRDGNESILASINSDQSLGIRGR